MIFKWFCFRRIHRLCYFHKEQLWISSLCQTWLKKYEIIRSIWNLLKEISFVAFNMQEGKIGIKNPAKIRQISNRHLGSTLGTLAYMPITHMVLKIYIPCKNFHITSQYLVETCNGKDDVYCWKNKHIYCQKIFVWLDAQPHKFTC